MYVLESLLQPISVPQILQGKEAELMGVDPSWIVSPNRCGFENVVQFLGQKLSPVHCDAPYSSVKFR